MTSRRADIQERKDRVLGITVSRYIKSVTPVSSKYIAQEQLHDLSSATIRNILAELEEEGFLMHPHTSAGRIPTEKGYRYYVDYLMAEIELLEEEKSRIRQEYLREKKELEEVFDRVSQAISDTTQYTCIISVDGWGNKIFCKGRSYIVEYPDQQDIHKIKSILAALEEKERVLQLINCDLAKRVKILIGHEIAYEEMDNCSLVVSRYQTDKGPSGRIAVLGPTRMDYERVVSTLGYFSQLMKDIL